MIRQRLFYAMIPGLVFFAGFNLWLMLRDSSGWFDRLSNDDRLLLVLLFIGLINALSFARQIVKDIRGG